MELRAREPLKLWNADPTPYPKHRASSTPDPWRTDETILTPSTLLPPPRDGITPLD